MLDAASLLGRGGAGFPHRQDDCGGCPDDHQLASAASAGSRWSTRNSILGWGPYPVRWLRGSIVAALNVSAQASLGPSLHRVGNRAGPHRRTPAISECGPTRQSQNGRGSEPAGCCIAASGHPGVDRTNSMMIIATSGPAPPCRKWPPWLVAWRSPVAPGMCCWRAASWPAVTGSESLKTVRNGLSKRRRLFQAAILGSLAESSGVMGTRTGNCLAPAL